MNFRNTFIVAALVALAASALSQTTSTSTKWVPLQMNLPKEILGATPGGAKNTSDVLHLSINMPYRNPAGMQAFVDSLSDPKSPNYRQFVTPEQIGTMYGQPTSNVAQLTSYLTSQGFKIKLVGKNHITVLADATVAQAQAAFNINLETYSTPATSTEPARIHFSYTTPPQLPATLASFVSSVTGLNDFGHVKRRAYILPPQLQTAYAVASMYNAGNTGSGRTIAISNFDGYRLANLTGWYSNSLFTLPAPSGGVGTNVTVVPIDSKNGNTYTQNIEGDLDIQCVLGIAPKCNLMIYDDASISDATFDSDPLGVVTKEQDDNLADIVTESYGWNLPSDTFAALHNEHVSMSAQGMTYMAASGDDGTPEITEFPYPDEEPEVLIVGGTEISTDSSGNRTSEVGWSGSVGGWVVTSDAFNVHPSYQTGFGVPTAASVPYRLSPDVSFNAGSLTTYTLYLDGGEDVGGNSIPSSGLYQGFYGTSAATPTCAGSLADTEQYVISQGGLPANGAGKQRLGRIQDLLYGLNSATATNASVFTDITTGTSNGNLPNGNPSNAASGWDTETGWGPIIFSGLATAILGLPTPATLTISPNVVIGGTSATGTVTLNAAAHTGGQVVALSSNNANATVPTSVTVASGSTSATFTITTVAVSASAIATVTASANSVSKTATLTINPATVSTLTVNPTSVTGGSSSTGTVTLNGPAISGGLTVNLSSSASAAVTPANVTVAAGATTATFTITTVPVATSTPATIQATQGGVSATAVLTVNPPTLSALSVSPTSVVGGTSSTGTLTLGSAAPSGGLGVNLSSSSSSAVPPASVTVAAGATTATFTITTTPVATSTPATITATLNGGSKTAVLTITPPVLVGFTVSPTTVVGGTSVRGTATLGSAAPTGGAVIKFTSNSSNATPPAQNTVPAGGTVASFNITTTAVTTTTTATLTATYNGTSLNATLTITNTSLTGVSVSPTSVLGGTSSTGTVTLSAGAPTGGASITLSSNNSCATPPGSVTVAAGATTATFTITTTGVGTTTTATITASFGGGSKTAALTVTTPTIQSFTVSPTSVVGGTSSRGTVTLSSAAPTGGSVIKFSSNNSCATPPTQNTIAAGTTVANFGITTTSVTTPTTATLTATYGASSVNTSLTVNPPLPLLISFTVSPTSVVGGTSSRGTATLNGPAPAGGSVIKFTSNSTDAVPPAQNTVPAGGTTASFGITTSAVTTSVTATITATYNGTSLNASLVVTPPLPTLISFTISPTTVVGGVSSRGTATISEAAPTGGCVIKFTTNNSNAVPPSSNTIPAGGTQANFSISTLTVTSTNTATITATYNGTSLTATLTINP